MSPQWEAWKQQRHALPAKACAFETWLFIQIAGVLFAGKAGELLMLSQARHQLRLDEQVDYIADRARVWHYAYQVLTQQPACARVVLYDAATVQATLNATPRWVFDVLGYPHDVHAHDFLAEIGRRWNQHGKIPHEIGLALGYPVKDVMGYMGLTCTACTATCGWRVHGDPEPSLQKSRQYKHAREQAKAFVLQP